MKIAFLLGSLNRGGLETLILDTFNSSKKANFTMIGIHRKGGAYQNEFYDSGVKMLYIPIKNIIKYLYNLRKTIQKEKVTIVHAQMWFDALLAYIALIGLNTPIILSFHGYDFNISKTHERLTRFIANKADKLIFVSNHQKEYYINKYNIHRQKCHVVYNGINFNKLKNTVQQAPIPYNNNDSIKMCMVGNFVRVREQNTVCSFLNLLKNKGINYDFYFVGRKNDAEPSLFDDCVKYCEENKISDRVHFLGARGDVPAILKQMDAFVYSTDHDTFGIAVVEAIAAGLPTFVNDWDVMKEVTHNGDIATLYKTKDANDLLVKFMHFVDNREEYKTKATQNAVKVKKLYSIEQHINDLENVYRS